MTEILKVWQPSQHLNGVQGRSGLLTFCISAMILVALQNISLIDFLCNKKTCLFCKKFLSFLFFFFPLVISTIPKKVGNPIKIDKILQQKFRGIPAKLLRKKNKTCLGFGV